MWKELYASMCAQTFHKLTRPHPHPPTKSGVFSIQGCQLPLRNLTAIKPRVKGRSFGSKATGWICSRHTWPRGGKHGARSGWGGHLRVPIGLALDFVAWKEVLILGWSQSTELCLTLCTYETTTAEITQGFAAKQFLLEVFQTKAVEFFRETYDWILYVHPENNVVRVALYVSEFYLAPTAI